ncbi:hypothetical protein OTB20_39510 [Streptomyces sp. H27-H1]|uniref:hypothetical protein n=1 Tax=Streptomyces sp. H27-H1 TaxID=2996461 RepID=UPI00227053D8|nr:hypothetical protein [Streptomyces sp. H27-H1]MCY0932150.1 hypothetical protein [Streptomyces sp. H27-H1]
MEAVRAAIDATAEARGPWVRDIGLLSDCLHALTARPPGTRRVGLDAILRLPRRPALIAEVLDRAGLGPQAERAEIMRLGSVSWIS